MKKKEQCQKQKAAQAAAEAAEKEAGGDEEEWEESEESDDEFEEDDGDGEDAGGDAGDCVAGNGRNRKGNRSGLRGQPDPCLRRNGDRSTASRPAVGRFVPEICISVSDGRRGEPYPQGVVLEGQAGSTTPKCLRIPKFIFRS